MTDPFALGFRHPGPILLSAIPLLVNVGILAYSLRKLPRDRLTTLFVLFLCGLCGWQAFDVMVRASYTEETARFWRQLFYPAQLLTLPFGVHFALLYTNRERAAAHPLVLSLLYLPAALFIGTRWNETLVDRESIGFVVAYSGPLDSAMLAWGSLVSLVMLAILGTGTFAVRRDPDRYRQAIVVFVGLLVPVGLGIALEAVVPLLGLPQIPIVSTAISAFSIATAVALASLKLFDVSSGAVATAVLTTMRDPLVIVNPQTRLLFANREAQLRFGIDPDRVRSHRLGELFPDELAWRTFREAVWGPTLAGLPVMGHETVLRGQKGDIPVVVSATALETGRDDSIAVLILAHDVSGLKAAERDLRAAKRLAEQANREKSLFLAGVRHDLRAPVNTVIGLAQGVDEHVEPAGKEGMERIRGTANHLLTLIDDVTGLARLETGDIDTVPVETDLPGLLREVVEMVEPLLQRSGDRLTLGGAPGVGALVTDPIRVRQMLVFLLSRAARVSAKAEVLLLVDSDVDAVRFEIRDRGPEVDKAQTEALSNGVAGRIANALGGEIAVQSAPNGTAITVRIARRLA